MSNKRKTATKAEIFYIQSNPENKTYEELADELNLFKTTVETISLEAPPKEESQVVEVQEVEPEILVHPSTTTTKPQKKNRMEGFVLTKTEAAGKPGRVAVMTGAGSERIDDANKLARQVARAQTNNTGITKTYPDRE